jgi:hypothetical protein
MDRYTASTSISARTGCQQVGTILLVMTQEPLDFPHMSVTQCSSSEPVFTIYENQMQLQTCGEQETTTKLQYCWLCSELVLSNAKHGLEMQIYCIPLLFHTSIQMLPPDVQQKQVPQLHAVRLLFAEKLLSPLPSHSDPPCSL